jgi:lipid-A-disaccharide synthase-like uncharacterized protein
MKGKIVRIFWGIALIALGALSLADKLGYVNLELITNQMWTIAFAVTSAAFFLSYILSGVKQWGWLFPALIFAALALTIKMTDGNPDGPIIAIPILLSIAIPFYVGYLMNHRHWGLLIPAWVLTVVAVIPALTERIDSNLIAALFLYAIALPFLVAYLVNRQRQWAFITAAVMAFIGSLPLIDYFIHGDIQGFIGMFLFSLPFLVTYFVSKKNWWAVIPAGGFISIGIVALLDSLLPNHAYIPMGDYQIGIYTSLIFLGFAITFLVLWLMRSSHPTDWAKYPAIGFLIIALMGIGFEDFLPAVVLFIIGVGMLTGALLKKEVTNRSSS